MAIKTRIHPDRAHVIQQVWAVLYPKKTKGQQIKTVAMPLPYRDTALCLVRAIELLKAASEPISELLLRRIWAPPQH